jgi:hypothetical protein
VTWFFGCDSGTGSNPCGTSFYMGRLGFGTTPSVLWSMRETDATPAFPYWNIQGPDAASGLSPEDWGVEQARAYYARYAHYPYPSAKRGRTLFGAVSAGSGGWDETGTLEAVLRNRGVVTGFLDSLAWDAAHGPAGHFSLGLYGNLDSEFQGLLHSGEWYFPHPVVVWLAGYIDTEDCSTAIDQYCPMPDVAGYFPMIWQYHGSPDLDVTPYSGGPVDAHFQPIRAPGVC